MLFNWILTVFTRILSWLIPFTVCVYSCLPCTKRGQLLYKNRNISVAYITSHYCYLAVFRRYDSSPQNYIAWFWVKKSKEDLCYCFTHIFICFGSELFYLHTYFHVIILCKLLTPYIYSLFLDNWILTNEPSKMAE